MGLGTEVDKNQRDGKIKSVARYTRCGGKARGVICCIGTWRQQVVGNCQCDFATVSPELLQLQLTITAYVIQWG